MFTYPIAFTQTSSGSGGWTPADGFTGTEEFWYEASTLTKDGSNHVTTWDDSFSTGQDLDDVTGTPLWTSSDVNGYDSVTFDGSESIRRTAGDWGSGISMPYIFWVVYKFDTVPGSEQRIIQGLTGGDANFSAVDSSGTDRYQFEGGGGRRYDATTFDTNWHYFLIEAVSNTEVEGYFDSDSVITWDTDSNGDHDWDGLRIGADPSNTRDFYGRIQQCGMVSGTPDSTDLSNLHTYLGAIIS